MVAGKSRPLVNGVVLILNVGVATTSPAFPFLTTGFNDN
jgi:hypothetical protein